MNSLLRLQRQKDVFVCILSASNSSMFLMSSFRLFSYALKCLKMFICSVFSLLHWNKVIETFLQGLLVSASITEMEDHGGHLLCFVQDFSKAWFCSLLASWSCTFCTFQQKDCDSPCHNILQYFQFCTFLLLEIGIRLP